MVTNSDRARRLDEILPFYPEDQRTNMIDLLTDAMHWCNANDEDFEKIFLMARIHFETEMSEST